MKISKVVLLAVLVLSVTVLPLFAAGQSGGASKGKITFWMELQTHQSANYANMGDTPFAKELSRRTGIDVEYLHPPSGAARDAFNLMVADGNYPDIIEWNFASAYSGGPEKAIGDGVIIPLNDIIDKNMPYLKKVLTDNPAWAKESRTDSGIYYVFPFIRSHERLSFPSNFIVRKDWLDDLGMQYPTTLDEIYNVLIAFRDKKGATAPFTSEKNLLGNNAFILAYEQMFDWYIHQDGKVRFGVIEPDFRRYVETMAKWYREGLIDKDYFSMNFDTVSAKMLNGQSGMSMGSINSRMTTWNVTAKKTNPNYSLICVPRPTLTKGAKFILDSWDYAFAPACLSGISGTTKNQELAARFQDYGYSPEGHMLFNFGIEGVSYNMINGFPTYTNIVINNPQGWPSSQGLGAYARAGIGGAMIQDVRYFDQYLNSSDSIYSLDLVFGVFAAQKPFHSNLPLMTPTLNESQELSRIMNEINTYVQEMVTKYILGTENINTFDNFVTTVRRMGIDRAIAIQNATYSRFIAR